MAPRTTKPKPSDPSPLDPQTDKAKIEKAPKAAKPKPEKVTNPTKPKIEKVDKLKPDKAPPKAKINREGEGKGGVKGGKEEKIKAVNGEEAVALIAAYLKATNRPYSATEISANLHGKVTKTVADKLLKEMEQNAVIMGKATNGDKKGSQWVFWTLQDPADAATPEELATMDSTIHTLSNTIPSLKTTLKNTTTKLATILAAPTTTALSTMIQTLQASNAVKASKLQACRDGTVKMVSREEVESVDREERYWKGKERCRREAFRALEDCVLQGGGSREELWEKLGIEGDE